jgi:Flp pilus assembly protein TadB
MLWRLLYDVVLALAALLAAYAVAWLRRQIGVEAMRRIEAELTTKQELAALAVRFTEQVYRDLRGEEKYNKAAEWLAARAAELGLNVTPDEIKGLIEAALRAFKDEFGEEWAKTIETSNAA